MRLLKLMIQQAVGERRTEMRKRRRIEGIEKNTFKKLKFKLHIFCVGELDN